MIGQHGRLAQQAGAQCHAGGIELRQVHLDHVMGSDKLGRHQAEGGGQDSLADAGYHRHPDDLHAFHHFLARQRRVVLGGHHRDLVTALCKGLCQALGINGQPGCMGTIVCKYGQNFHMSFSFEAELRRGMKAQGLYPR